MPTMASKALDNLLNWHRDQLLLNQNPAKSLFEVSLCQFQQPLSYSNQEHAGPLLDVDLLMAAIVLLLVIFFIYPFTTIESGALLCNKAPDCS
jgi:hypothetical protein